MIPRYSRDLASMIWSDDYRLSLMLEIELAACEAQVKLGKVPEESFKVIKELASFEVERIREIESVVRHDVIAFLTNVAEKVGEDSRYLHLGMTSSDVLDTCFSVQLVRASDLLIQTLREILAVLKSRAFDTKNLLCIGRTHGIHAEPMSFGLKFARFYAEFERALNRLIWVQDEIRICKISGAVGTFSTIDPFVEQYVADSLGLIPETIATQVIPRDRHAMFFATLSVVASSIENLVTEIRHLQKSEVLELSEGFAVGQKGSSAMPHKKNPVLSENLTGLVRMVRGSIIPMLENVALWHERDISHSSVERILAPDVCIVLDFALIRLKQILTDLVVYEDNITANIECLNGLVFSQSLLLKLVESGLNREEAYSIVQSHALQSWSNKSSFYELVINDEFIKQRIPDLNSIFDLAVYTRHVDFIFNKVFK